MFGQMTNYLSEVVLVVLSSFVNRVRCITRETRGHTLKASWAVLAGTGAILTVIGGLPRNLTSHASGTALNRYREHTRTEGRATFQTYDSGLAF